MPRPARYGAVPVVANASKAGPVTGTRIGAPRRTAAHAAAPTVTWTARIAIVRYTESATDSQSKNEAGCLWSLATGSPERQIPPWAVAGQFWAPRNRPRRVELSYSPIDGAEIKRILLIMNNASATYTVLSKTEALIEVSYPNGTFGFERVTKPRSGSLYEAAYNAASIKATIQGTILGRFSRAP